MTKLRQFEKRVSKCASSRPRRSFAPTSPRQLLIALGLLFLISASRSVGENGKKTHHPKKASQNAPGVLWVQPADIASRDLFYGPKGKDHEPHTTFTFLREDLHGTNPKFDVHDENGTKWRVKLGAEARPETAASRLLWAAGYFANEDYFRPDLRAEEMKPLKRGQKLVGLDVTMTNVRLKRFVKNEKDIGSWRWHS